MVTARNALDVLIPELAKVRAQESGSKADPMSEYSVSVTLGGAQLLTSASPSQWRLTSRHTRVHVVVVDSLLTVHVRLYVHAVF